MHLPLFKCQPLLNIRKLYLPLLTKTLTKKHAHAKNNSKLKARSKRERGIRTHLEGRATAMHTIEIPAWTHIPHANIGFSYALRRYDKYPVSLLHLATNWLVLLYDLNRYVTLGFRSPMCRPEYAGWTSISNYFCSSILATLVIISLLLFRYLLTPLKRTAAYNIAIAMESSLSCR